MQQEVGDGPHGSPWFIGDYSGVATVGTAVVATWTDQRLQSYLFDVCGANQNTFTAVTLRR